MDKRHNYSLTIQWTGNRGSGTSDYRSYDRNHVIRSASKADIQGSSDPAFRGDPARYNPEDLLVASLSACHMLAYLHLCAVAGVVVTEYLDHAIGTLAETPDGGGHFTEVILKPEVMVRSSPMIAKAMELHHKAAEVCFIASSVNFPVRHEPSVTAQED